MFKLFGSIQKVEEAEDGTIMVFGIASTPSRDAVGEIVDPEAMKAALPDYERFPALREMHQPMAAGKVVSADVDDDGITHIQAHVVDPVAIVKVRTGVYQGFSIGGKVLKRDPQDRSIIKALRLVEISLVDSPCNPDAILSMWKADTMKIENPTSAEVIARAKDLAKAAGTQRYREFLFQAREDIVAERTMEAVEKGELELEAPGDVTKPDTPADQVTETPETEPEVKEAAAEGGEVEQKAGSVETGAENATGVEGGEAKEAADQPGEEAESGAEAPANEGGDQSEGTEKANEPDPADALAAAIESGKDLIKAAIEPPADEPGPFADLAKAAIAMRGIGIESADIPEGGELPAPIAKSLWHVGRFAELLESLGCIQNSLHWEQNCEGDDSKIPEELRGQLAGLAATLTALCNEEVAEFLAALAGNETVELSLKGDEAKLAGDLVEAIRADAELMGKAAERIQPAAAIEPPAGDQAPEGDEAEKAARIAELESENERLSKALESGASGVEELTKRFGETIDGLKAEIGDLTQKFEALDQTPVPAKTAGPAAGRVVQKGQDSAGAGGQGGGEAPTLSQDQVNEAWASMSEADKGDLLVRVALANPSRVALPAPRLGA